MPPRLPAGLIWRPRLAAAVDTGVQRAATLLCAGPGWGKTALAASWAVARSLSGPVAWLTLDAQHNDPYAFWSDLILALRTAGAIPPGRSFPDRGPTSVAQEPAFRRAFAAGVTGLSAPVVVVLDGLHEVTDRRVVSGISGMLQHLSERLRFVLISRRAPALPVHRLRVTGDLTEIRQADLAFRLDEAADLLGVRGRTMAPGTLAEIVRRMEGWAAGLRLAFDTPDPAGADEIVEDYLIREVMSERPADIRRFVMQTSITDRICGDLADAVTGGSRGHETLESLTRENMFVERSGAGRWFRYHPLFRSALRRRVARQLPDALPELHLAAARWYERDGNGLSALTHAIEAGNWDLAGRIVVRRGLPLFGSADRQEFTDVLRRIPPARLTETAELAVCAILLAYARGDLAAVPHRLALARALLVNRDEAARSEVSMALALLEASVVTRWHGDMPRLARSSTDLLGDLARLSWDQAPSLLQYRAMTLNNKGAALLWSDRFDRADRYLWAAVTAARTARSPIFEINSLALLAQLAVQQGALREAAEHAAAADGIACRIDARGRIAVAPAYLAQAMIESERGREPEAEDALRHGLHAMGAIPEAALSIVAGLIRVRLTLDRGEAASARAMLTQLRTEAGPPLAAPLLDRLLDLAGAEIRLALGDPEPVLVRYGGRPDLSAAEQVCLARAHLAGGDLPAAERLLESVRHGSDRVSAVGAWILTALAADTQGRSSAASEALSMALAHAEPDRIRRPFRTYDAQRVLVLAERQQWLTELRGAAGDSVLGEITAEIPVIASAPAVEPLSEREVDVLQFMPTVLTAAEIAKNLGISVNTVKAHMRSIYRKLGAGRRREAVVTARQAGLI
ncbi:LuxR C-terminal-related transcriptional regulator [Actinoplanes sp. NEAU-A12]|uniref:LuxR C-terminal-related transcriptional regulator n=1 Tax=Actinoplanes sandaracinus TaxID=3045177 RepID=A0ABT6WZV6_9ACTN|nr:LuxR C-terminal-related transcriptional regulator [Actinoplanes sandaracinus]